jgi:hypothetical protein
MTALKLPQPAACPQSIGHSLKWKDSSSCVVAIRTQSQAGEGEGKGQGLRNTAMFTSY